MIPPSSAETGWYRVLACEQRVSAIRKPFTKFVLGNARETIPAFAWAGMYDGAKEVPRGSVALCLVRKRTLNGRPVADLYDCALLEPNPKKALELIPSVLVRDPSHLARLAGLIESLNHEPLKEFVQRAFLEFGFMERFITEPASLHFHHAFPGGLLAHSLECAEAVAWFPGLETDLRDLAVVAALFHDAGKTLVFRNQRRTRIGHLVSHDALTLRALHAPLSWLEQAWPDASHALMHIWTCRSEKRWGYRTLNPVAQLVQMADRWSAESDKYRAAFADAGPWQNCAQFANGESFWRPLPPEDNGTLAMKERVNG